MNKIGYQQPLIIIVSAVSGLVVATWCNLGQQAILWVEIFLASLLYILFLSVDMTKIRNSFLNFRFASSAVVLNFIFTPFLAYLLGLVFYGNAIDIRIGLVMLLVTPCTDWYLVFTGLSEGNVALGLSILPLNLILQALLLPLYVFLSVGKHIEIDLFSMISNTALILLVPFGASLLTKKWMEHREKIKAFFEALGNYLQLFFLCMAVFAMFAAEGKILLKIPGCC